MSGYLNGSENKNCPVCGYSFDIHTHVIGHGPARAPQMGDVTMCFNCDTVFYFNAAGNIVIPSDRELSEIMADPRMQAMTEQTRLAIKNRPNPN